MSPYLNASQVLLSVSCAMDLSVADISVAGEQSLARLSAIVSEQYARFATAFITPVYKKQLLNELLQSLENCLLHLDAEEPVVFSRQESDQVTADYFGPDKNQAMHQREFQVYDGFFRQYRTQSQGVVGFLRQFLALYHAMVLDLRNMEMPGVEYAHAWRLLLQVLELLKPKYRCIETAAKGTSSSLTLLQADCFDAFWSQNPCIEAEDLQVQIAFYRWFCGHQLWNSALHFGSAYIQELLLSFEEMPVERVQESVYPVFVMMRGFVSLIWYTLSFPSALYARHISTAMFAYSKSRGSKGLSGATGQDYSHYAKQLRRLHAALLERYRESPDEALRGVIEMLQHYDLLFHEHHIILASEKVNLAYFSILQRLSGVAENPNILPAVTGMRERHGFLGNRYKKAWAL